jgi:hypothetical protein
MKLDGHGSCNPEQWRLDRVIIAAAVMALYGPAARIRSIAPVSSDRAPAWVRQGRLRLQTSQRSPALARTGPAFERGRP